MNARKVENMENKENKEYEESEKPERGQCELDDNVLEQAAGGGFQQWVKDAWDRIENNG